MGGVEWESQAAYCAMGKDRFWGIQSAPIPRAGPRQVASGVSWLMGAEAADPLVAAAANVHDTKLLRQTLEDIVVARQGGPGKGEPGKPRRTWDLEATENLGSHGGPRRTWEATENLGSHGEPGKPRTRDMTAPRAVRRSLTGDAGRKFDA